MPRRQFIADLQKAQDGIHPPGVHNIRAGEDDGQFEFETAATTLAGAPITVTITAMIPDVSDYPASHEYMIFCGEDAPPHAAKALQDVRKTARKTVFELVDIVAACINALAPRPKDLDGDFAMNDPVSEAEDDEDQFDEDEDADDIYDVDDDGAFSYGDPVSTADTAHLPETLQPNAITTRDKPYRDRVRSDLRAAKDAGFRVGHLGSLLDGYSSFVTVSIRVSKLGISTEALQAWQVDPSEYLILIIQYPNGYKTNEQLQAYDSIRLKSNIGMRVVAGKKYKPSIQEAINVFTKVRTDRSSSANDTKQNGGSSSADSSVHDIFISSPLAAMLQENLLPILRFRSTGMDWSGAEAYYNYLKNTTSKDDPNAIPDKFYEPEAVNKAFPNILQDDQYRHRDVVQYSFPLLAMQFTLRHFARCTDFCMVCHAKLDNELEAIKPYVCESPLCLFQYMSLGFGPSIEHEIISQPYVVDLLISFCYNSAKDYRLKDFPDGLSLKVPPIAWLPVPAQHHRYHQIHQAEEQQPAPSTVKPYEVGFDPARREVIFFDKPDGGCPVARGQWIVISYTPGTLGATSEEMHCRVVETNFYPTIKVDKPVVVPLNGASTVLAGTSTLAGKSAKTPPTPSEERPFTPAATPKWTSAAFLPYNQEFNELSSQQKCQAICKLLDTLPSVDEMRKYLATQHPADLKNWVDRVPRDALNLLRWIIASNRACIMQVESEGDGRSAGTKGHTQERLHGMEGYMQFRFAMGAPDKETRFVSEVRKTAERLSLQYPTIFAWHGSPLHNWHMIIREGLHFKNTDHGRAYGHGVYHAKDAQTSTGYSSMSHSLSSWPNSMLRISSALALNEIVNAPSEFVSNNPYYVVAQLDWIQTRYLLVKCQPLDENIKPGIEAMPKSVHPQDPHATPKGATGTAVAIPASAIKSGKIVKAVGTLEKRRSVSSGSTTNKKRKDQLGESIATAIDLDNEDTQSVDTDIEDLEILFEEPEPEPIVREQTVVHGKARASAEPTTDYVPGSLDFSTLPLMPTPTYATSATTKRLLSELKALNKVHSATSPASLGWSVDAPKIENVYQWIVELHSFHTFSINNAPLPLVADMKKANAKSIVVEIRFGPDFPYSPPYIRVIRPRFLPFTQGGGGHIVIGGAMCMELLTNSGWSSVMSMESVLMQVRMAIASEPFARLEGKSSSSSLSSRNNYGAAEAAEGYLRACNSHGWKVPPGFKEVAYGMSSAQAGAGANA